MSVTQSILPYSVEGVVCNSICPIVAVYCLAALGRCVCRPLQDCIFQCPLIDLSSSRALHTVLGVKGLLHIRPYSTYAKLLLERLLFVCYSKVTWSPLTNSWICASRYCTVTDQNVQHNKHKNTNGRHEYSLQNNASSVKVF